jgi:hypothetical protein
LLSWNEIRARCAAFAEHWRDASDEDADAKSFWDHLFTCYGANRRQVASFEAPVRMLNGNLGFIDLIWKGKLLVEHKSRGKDLNGPQPRTGLHRAAQAPRAPALAKAHATLDQAVDRCYRKQPFHTDRERVEYLFALYEKLATPLAPSAKKPRKTKA